MPGYKYKTPGRKKDWKHPRNIGVCEICGEEDRLTTFQKKRVCGRCLTDDKNWNEYIKNKRKTFFGSNQVQLGTGEFKTR